MIRIQCKKLVLSILQKSSKRIYFNCVALLLCITSICFAQQPNPTTTNNQTKSFKLFFEKVYLHLDRNYYTSGDDIWFKAYLVNGLSNYLMATSNNLYVELISSNYKIIDRKVIRLNDGVGNGDFKLGDSIPDGTYKIRAYTQWMINFEQLFIFEKEIKVVSVSPIKGNTSIVEKNNAVIQFFPEGGSLINGIMNVVAFKATDENGNSCNIKGAIVSSDGDTLCWIESIHLGMGTFAFIPESGKKYTAVCYIKNEILIKTILLQGLDKGFCLHVTDRDTSSFIISVSTNQETLKDFQNKQMIIGARAFSKTHTSATFLLAKDRVDLRLSKRNFPYGISEITLYDSLLKPYCERLVFVSRYESVKMSVTPDKVDYKTHEKTTLQIKATNIAGQPVKSHISLAVVDNTIVPENANHIVSYLLLESEIKGKIEQPKLYFDPTNPRRFKQLDLLLLTQGWRDFVWHRIADTTYKIRYMVEPGITISGRVRQKLVDKSLPGMNITAYIPGASKNKIFTDTTNNKGEFYIMGIEFYGKKNVIVTSRDNKGKKGGWLLLDSLFAKPIPVKPFYIEPDTIQKSKYANESLSRRNTLRKYRLSDTIALNEVVVTASKSREEKQKNEHIAEAGEPDYVYNLGAEDQAFSDLGSFMMQKIPGARFPDTTNPGDPFNRVLFNVYGKKEPPRFIVDGHKMQKGDINDENYVYNIPVSDIEKIMVSKTDFQSGTTGYVISIFTSSNAGQRVEFYTTNTKLDGYYEPRVFYAPDYSKPNTQPYKPDLRTTIYWAPNLTTNENGTCEVSFYNSDKAAQVRVNVEGISEKGVPVIGNGVYEVK